MNSCSSRTSLNKITIAGYIKDGIAVFKIFFCGKSTVTFDTNSFSSRIFCIIIKLNCNSLPNHACLYASTTFNNKSLIRKIHCAVFTSWLSIIDFERYTANSIFYITIICCICANSASTCYIINLLISSIDSIRTQLNSFCTSFGSKTVSSNCYIISTRRRTNLKCSISQHIIP